MEISLDGSLGKNRTFFTGGPFLLVWKPSSDRILFVDRCRPDRMYKKLRCQRSELSSFYMEGV